jgi:hypothetical protein
MARDVVKELSAGYAAKGDNGAPGTARPLPVAVLGNGAKMLMMLYNDVELIARVDDDGVERLRPVERRSPSRYQEEIARMKRAFMVGCGSTGDVIIEATIIEPFMPKQETAHGLALAPEAYLLQRGLATADLSRRESWGSQSAYRVSDDGVVYQSMTDEFKDLVDGSFAALRDAFDDDAEFLEFLASIFDPPQGMDRYSFEAYFRGVWLQCKRHNPEPTLPGQPLPHKNTIAGRYVEVLTAMNKMMRTA